MDALRAHRVGALAWVLAGGLAMVVMTAALATEMADFPGGQQALAASVAAGAEAMRPLRWPAERLDTLGGYLTYHNVILFNFFLAIYGVIQGSRDIRGAEERGSLELVLATGRPRWAVVRDRAAGFFIIAMLIGLGLGLGMAAGLAVAGEPDLGGSLITMATSGLVAMVGYALGMLLSQVAGSTRAAAGVGAAVLTVLYVATNVAETGAPASVVGIVSPFHFANQSRALVPGYGLDLRATIALLALAAVLLGLAAWAFARRDYAAPLWVRRNRARGEVAGPGSGRVPRVMLGSVWAAALRRGWVGLTFWVVCAGAFAAMYATLQPTVLTMWDEFHFIEAMTGALGATSIEAAYWSFCGEMVTPVIAAYVITQASGWVADLAQGRVEMITSAPVSWAMLVRGRLIATIIGVAAIIAGTLVGLGAGAVAVGSSIDPAGAGRLFLVGVLLGAALAGVAGLAVAVVRRSAAVTVLAVIVGAMYLLSYLVPIFGWPDWLNLLSVFWAFGHPYLQWPSTGRLVVLVVLAVGCAVAAAAAAERSPKVAS